MGDGLAGSVGASTSNLITYPLDLIITRLQIQKQYQKNASDTSVQEYRGLIDATEKIYNNEGGLSGFYAGLASDTLKTLADSFFFFLLYNHLRRERLSKTGGKQILPAHEELGVGFVAGATTKLITTPIANVVTRQQAAALSAPRNQTPSFLEIAGKIYTEEGPSGFWSGYSASLILTLNPTLTFFLFEFFKRLTLPQSKRTNPPPVATFLLAALSKACASSVTYPFSLAKARLQAGGLNNKEEDDRQDRAHEGTPPSEKGKIEKLERKAARNTLFSTLRAIYKTEGPVALYEGLHLEVLRAFLSHGITMLVKQFISRIISRIYYISTIVFSRYTRETSRRASRLAERAKDTSVGYYDLSIKRVNEKMQEAADAALVKANEVAEFVHEYVDEDDSDWKELYGTTGLSKWLDQRFDDSEKS